MISLTRRLRYVVLLTVAFSMALSSIPFAVSAQQVDAHASEANGRTIEWSDDWELNTQAYEEDLQIDRVMIQGVDDPVMMNVVFMADTFNRTEVRDALLDSLKTEESSYHLIDSGDYDNLSYELSVFELEGLEVGSFILVFTNNGTTALHIIAPIDDFADAVALSQRTVTLDGEGTFSGIDGTSLQSQLEIAAASSSATTSTTGNHSTRSSGTSSTRSSTSSSTNSSDRSYTSPVWGYTVKYSSGWRTDASLDLGDFAVVNRTMDSIVSFQGLENQGLDGTMLEMALAQTFADSVGGSGNVIGSASNADRAVFVGSIDGNMMIQEMIVVSPSTIVMVTAVITGDFESSLSDLQSISVNGVRIFALI